MNKFCTVSCIFFCFSISSLQACSSEDGQSDWQEYTLLSVEAPKSIINFIEKNKTEAGKTPLRGRIPAMTEDQLYAQFFANQIREIQRQSNEKLNIKKFKKQSSFDLFQ